MDTQSFYGMTHQTFASINAPLVFSIIAANIFFGFCLVLNRQRLKPPLRILLGWLIVCSNIYCVSLVVLYCFLRTQKSVVVLIVSWVIVVYSTHNSMTCYVWLNFYYYVHIVPTQRALLIWMKRNIKFVILVALIANSGIFSAGGAFVVVDNLYFGIYEFTDSNRTQTGQHNSLLTACRAAFVLIQLYVFICLWIMIVSSFSTARYLHRHMRNIARSGNRVTTSIRSQMRVTITGSLQGMLYMFFYVQYLTESFLAVFSSRFLLGVSFTISTVYLAVTTVNTGMGQTIIRQSVAGVWKTLKACRVVGVVTNDVHSSPK